MNRQFMHGVISLIYLIIMASVGNLTQPSLFAASLMEIASGSIGDSLGNKPVPNWSGGALITEEGAGTTNPLFLSYDRHGNLIASTPFSIPGTTYLSILNFSRGADGTIAVCGSATDAEGRTAPFVAWMKSDGRSTNVVRTTPYYPRKVTIASDGTVWTVGFESMPNKRTIANPDGFVFRRWDRSGKLAGAYVYQSQLKDSHSVYFIDLLRSSQGRVAWFSSREGRYIEISLAGTVVSVEGLQLSDPKLHIAGMALADSGDVILSTESNGKWAIMRLDLDRGHWVEVESGISGSGSLIYGAEGNSIVLRRGGKTGDFKFFQLVK